MRSLVLLSALKLYDHFFCGKRSGETISMLIKKHCNFIKVSMFRGFHIFSKKFLAHRAIY